MKKHFLWKTLGLGVSISTLLAAGYCLPLEETTVYAMEDSQTSSLQTNTNALDFIRQHAQPQDYALWKESAPDLYMTPAQAEELKHFVLTEVLKDKQAQPLQKAEQIFEWIKKEVRYARGNVQPYINPYQVFKHRTAVCGGYSNLYKAMLNAADVPSVIVYGTIPSGSQTNGYALDPAHQWNAVYADGQWFFSDSTWGGDFFKKNIKDFSTNHQTTNIYGVRYQEGDLTIGYEYSGLAVTAVADTVTHLQVPATSNGQAIRGLSTELAGSKADIRTMVIGSHIQYFEPAALAFPHLESIEVAADNPHMASREGVLFTKDLSEILYYPLNRKETRFTLPKETSKYDEKQTFQNPYLTQLSVEGGNPLFASYKGALFDRDFKQLLTVAEGATEVHIPGSVQLDHIGLSFKTKVQTVFLEEGITSIPSYVFNGTTGLREIHIPSSLQHIDPFAFHDVEKAAITLVGPADSPIKAYAQQQGLSYRVNKEKPPIEDKPDTGGEADTDLDKLTASRAVAQKRLEELAQLDKTGYPADRIAPLETAMQELTNLLETATQAEAIDEALKHVEEAYHQLLQSPRIQEQVGSELILEELPTYTGTLEQTGEALLADELPVYTGAVETVGESLIIEEAPTYTEPIGLTGEPLLAEEEPTYTGSLETSGEAALAPDLPIYPIKEETGTALLLEEKPTVPLPTDSETEQESHTPPTDQPPLPEHRQVTILPKTGTNHSLTYLGAGILLALFACYQRLLRTK